MSEEKSQQSIDIKLWAHEVGRYKGKCVRLQKEIDRLQKEIDRLREEIDRHIRTEDCLRGVIGLIVEEVGEVVIHREAIDEGRPMTQVDWDEENQTYTLRPVATTTE